MKRSVFDIPGFDWKQAANYQNAFLDQPAFLFGFSKSLNLLDVSKVEGMWTMGINWIIRRWQPSFHISLDPQPVAANYDLLKEASDHTLVVARRNEKFYYPPDLKTVFFNCDELLPLGPKAVYPPRMTAKFTGTATSASYATQWLYACGFDPIVLCAIDFSIEHHAYGVGAAAPAEYVKDLQTRFPRVTQGTLTFLDTCSATGKTHAQAVPATSARHGFIPRVENEFFTKFLRDVAKPQGRTIVNASAYKGSTFNALPFVDFDETVEKLRKEGHLR